MTRFEDLVEAPLTGDDGPNIQRLLESSSDYFELALGRPPGPAEALAVFYAGPEEGASPDGKLLFGYRRRADNALIAIVDGFANYPDQGVWYIGLLLLSPESRGTGLGQRLTDQFATRARSAGARELQLNVLEHNVAAHGFWTKRGFVEVRRWRQRYGNRESTFIRMRRPLTD